MTKSRPSVTLGADRNGAAGERREELQAQQSLLRK